MKKFLLSIARLLAPNAENLAEVGKKVNEILGNIVGPVLIALGAAGAVYMIVLGVQYAKADADDKRAEVKKRLVNCLIGVIIMIVLVVICMAIDWAKFVQIFGYIDGVES